MAIKHTGFTTNDGVYSVVDMWQIVRVSAFLDTTVLNYISQADFTKSCCLKNKNKLRNKLRVSSRVK